jgi:transposase-like protein
MGQILTNEARATIARKWRGSGQTQAVFAAEHGITDRTLRAWLNRWAPSHTASPEVVRELVEQTIERLRELVTNRDAGDGKPTPSVEVKAVETVPPAVAPQPSTAARATLHPDPSRGVAWDLGNVGGQ